MTPNLNRWRDGGHSVEIFGQGIFTRAEGPVDGPPLLVLHGFPTSSHDFEAALPWLADRYRVILFDHLGFGLSDKPRGYSYSLHEQADVALGVWRHHGVQRGHLLAHDYGTSVATELLARRARGLLPVDLSSVTLCNGSMYLHLADLTISQRLSRSPTVGPWVARLFNQRLFTAQMRRIVADPDRLGPEVFADMWAGILEGGGPEVIPAIQGYLTERERFFERWVGGLKAVDIPAHILWGRADPVALPAIAEAAAADTPGAELTFLEGLGHYPMIEGPEAWGIAARRFLDVSEGRREGAAARGGG